VWGLHSWRLINRNQKITLEPDTARHSRFIVWIWRASWPERPARASRTEFMPHRLGRSDYPKEDGNCFPMVLILAAFGLDGKLGIGSKFTVDYTVNPDFGQVEADPSELNLTAFETFFEEKRPFFIEGKNIFGFGIDDNQLFYSRRIGHSPSYDPVLNDEYA
jgi:hypothetical protein